MRRVPALGVPGAVVHHGDCREVLAELPDACIDAVVTDPPYELAFMGKAWDRGGIAYDPEVWAQVLRVLKPGGHLLSFGGTRTYHRMACAVEDAGFEIRDSIVWLHGQGFPKSKNVGNGWGTTLKPSMEPIVLARKPFKGTVANNVLTHGTGALNIDGCRIEGAPPKVTGRGWDGSPGYRGESGASIKVLAWEQPAGRWPPNVALDETVDFPEARFMYVAKASKRERPVVDGVAHSTVKPLALMRWLVRLVTPVGGLVLDPFAGSGSTLEACLLEGLHCYGVELSAEYLPLIQVRLDRQQPAPIEVPDTVAG
jgi:site-specific DNA-methyltransferase (adenine-specific)